MKNDVGPAFPLPKDRHLHDGYKCGMSLRDYFAAKAMQGMCSVHNEYGEWTGCGDMNMNKNMAETAYSIADAMLKAREGRE